MTAPLARARVSREEFDRLACPLVGMPVSRVWRGYGTAAFLELGALTPTGHRHFEKGEATVMVEWSWRVERPRRVLFGSFSGHRRVTNQLQRLEGAQVSNLCVTGRLPELVVEFVGGLWLHSFMTAEGQPEWTVFLPDGSWLRVRNGGLVRESKGALPPLII